MNSFLVIPARYASTRLPKKLLLDQTGKPLIQHTYEAAQRATKPTGIIVATDHAQIVESVKGFGGEVMLTNPKASSGTDRVAEVAQGLQEADIIVNVQGDEPEISAEAIDLAIELLEENPAAPMSTLATPIRNQSQLEDPSCVKVVFDGLGRAQYFSRSPIPYPRTWDDQLLSRTPAIFHQHIGLYAYRRDFLLSLAQLPQSDKEMTESLEQLRVLDAGHDILVGVVDEPTVGIDTPDDYEAFVRRTSSC